MRSPNYRLDRFQDDGGTPAWRANQRTLQAVPRYGNVRWIVALGVLAILPVVVLVWGFFGLILYGIGHALIFGDP
jgi:hypothetical protein